VSTKVGHSMPGCDKVLLVQAELDGELDAAQAAALEAHRVGCAICQAAQAELLRARALLRGEVYETTPDDVRARVMARLRQAEPRRAPARRRWVWPSVGGFSLGAACAAALALLVVLPQRDNLAGQLVAGHIRALQPGHLEVAPPVRDFAAEGFPLKGGRLDYLDGRAVAALVYQRDKHIIDLYVWPMDGVTPHLAGDTVIQGYNVAHWTAEGMNFWIVSDVERGQLDDFAALWRRSP
jgi:anti-sigma factor RsiW